ncbi:hypothetical protein GIB67_004534 [Kingdonia uniflora]|uniref:RNase H type-1 domain-containing protein n=1 Tax=Kingdonia uniflora TaxID=39325 RepID=A0A7J7ML96_9MAGN|nr:hypothetical protein GIB67_004534 [Kingdonia uniflora]
MGTLSKGIGLVTNFMAECKAIILGVEHAASFGWLIAGIESDSTTAVEAFEANNIPWILEAAWENSRRNMSNLDHRDIVSVSSKENDDKQSTAHDLVVSQDTMISFQLNGGVGEVDDKHTTTQGERGRCS